MKTSDYRSLPTHYPVTTASVNVLTMMAMAIFFGLALFMSSCTKDESFDEVENREEPTSLKVGLVGHWDFRGNANDLSERMDFTEQSLALLLHETGTAGITVLLVLTASLTILT